MIRPPCCRTPGCAPDWTAWMSPNAPPWRKPWPGTWPPTSCIASARSDTPPRPDPSAEAAVPVCREIDGEALARGIRQDGTLAVVFDGLRIPVALPPLATAILPLIDGQRSVGQIGSILSGRGARPDAFMNAWRQTFAALERINRVLLAAPRLIRSAQAFATSGCHHHGPGPCRNRRPCFRRRIAHSVQDAASPRRFRHRPAKTPRSPIPRR